MENTKFSSSNSQILTDDSCCLSKSELKALNVETVPFMAIENDLEKPLKSLLSKKEFVLFVGTAPSLSIINDTIEVAAENLDEKDKSLNAKKRVIIINTSCFSGGLGLFVTHFAHYFNSREHTYDELLAYSLFLANHIAHFFVKPCTKRWNNLIYVPRTGPINHNGGKFRGNRGVYNHLTEIFRDHAYHTDEKVWICYTGPNDREAKKDTDSKEAAKLESETFIQARSLARQFKRCQPETQIDISHQIKPHSVSSLKDDIIACFFLSTDVRPDEMGPRYNEALEQEIAEKTAIAKENITLITRFAQAFKENPMPQF